MWTWINGLFLIPNRCISIDQWLSSCRPNVLSNRVSLSIGVADTIQLYLIGTINYAESCIWNEWTENYIIEKIQLKDCFCAEFYVSTHLHYPRSRNIYVLPIIVYDFVDCGGFTCGLHLSANISIQACNYIVCAQCDDIWTVVIFHSLYLFVKGVAWQFQQNLNYGNGHNLRFNTLLKFCWLFLTIINCMGVLIQTLCNQIILMIFFVLSLNTYISVISPKNKCGLNAKWFIEKKSDWIVAPFSNHKWTDLKKICVQYLVSTGRN